MITIIMTIIIIKLEEISLAVAMLQQHVINVKLENLNLQEKARKDFQDLEKYYEENGQYVLRLCLRIRNLRKQENESSNKVLEVVKCFFGKASINIPDACIDHAHCVSRIDDTMIVHFTTFYYQTVLQERKELKNGVKIQLGFTKARLELLIKASKYVNSLSNVGFVHADIDCRFKIHF